MDEERTLLKKLTIALAGLVAANLLVGAGSLRAETNALSNVRSWAYQLQDIDAATIRTSPYDLAVVDYGFDKRNSIPHEIVDQMRVKRDGSRRFVLAYLSIGEAENFRSYWKPSWLTNRPEWLESENPNWPGNFPVQYWHPDWQSLMFGSPGAYLDRIIQSGFDGVYLDGIDKFEQWKKRRPTAGSDMVDFVVKIAAYARRQHKDFLIVPQNGDELLEDPRLLPVIDGYAREDLLYSEDDEGVRNRPDSISESVTRLKTVTNAHKPVLVVEYPTRQELGASLLREIKSFGFVGYIADRALKTLSPPIDGCGQPDCLR